MDASSPGRVAVITGASSGVGRAAALAFATAGFRLVLAARGVDALEDVAGACRGLGAAVLALPTDVSDRAAVDRLAEAAVERFGAIDVWANVAGIGAVGAFVQTPLDQHDQVIRTNLLGYLYGAHAAVRRFERQGAGVLINMNSVGAFAPSPYAVSYTASKFATRGMVLALRSELANQPDIHVCEVYGSFLDTPGIPHAANFTGRKLRPAPPVNDPERAAAAMLRLADAPQAEVMLDAPARAIRLGATFLPRPVGWGLSRFFELYTRLAERVPVTPGNTFQPSPPPGALHGGLRSRPLRILATAAGFGFVCAAAVGAAKWGRGHGAEAG